MSTQMQNGPTIEFLHPQTLDWSIVVPVHRKRDGLRRCLESVLPQLRDGMELVVADHSTERAGFDIAHQLVELLPEHHGRVLFTTPEPTGTMAGDWNRAVSLCRGRWVHLLHDDDFVLSRFYDEVGLRLAQQEPWALASTGYRNQNGDKVTLERPTFDRPVWPRLAAVNQFQPSAVVVARSTYETYGGYLADPSLRHCPDWEFLARCTSRGATWHLVDEVLAVHTEGSSECESAAPQDEVLCSYHALHEYMFSHGVQPDALAAGTQFLQQLAVRHALDRAMLKELADESKDMWRLAVDLERAKRRYEGQA